MGFSKRVKGSFRFYFGKKGAITSEFSIWMILAIIGLVVAAFIVYFEWDIIMTYLAKGYNFIRYGGRFG